MIADAPDFEGKKVSLWLTITLVIAAITLTAAVVSAWVSSQHTQSDLKEATEGIELRIEEKHQFALDEVSGLRSDWERHNEIVHEDIEELKQRIKELEN